MTLVVSRALGLNPQVYLRPRVLVFLVQTSLPFGLITSMYFFIENNFALRHSVGPFAGINLRYKMKLLSSISPIFNSQ